MLPPAGPPRPFSAWKFRAFGALRELRSDGGQHEEPCTVEAAEPARDASHVWTLHRFLGGRWGPDFRLVPTEEPVGLNIEGVRKTQ